MRQLSILTKGRGYFWRRTCLLLKESIYTPNWMRMSCSAWPEFEKFWRPSQFSFLPEQYLRLFLLLSHTQAEALGFSLTNVFLTLQMQVRVKKKNPFLYYGLVLTTLGFTVCIKSVSEHNHPMLTKPASEGPRIHKHIFF